ncbi:RPM1-interacting protein 4 family protein [Prunus dulcis]|uniref:RPM1-interacting protein 4 family protein n=1 Tax=Prunus dulcis TaxID=3755 RepID=A0A4Y1RJ86_PRUDU|nr:RPM1-interacting protein 4 family protein [Prunus dulcis]
MSFGFNRNGENETTRKGMLREDFIACQSLALEGFTVIFNKARDEKKTGGKPESPGKADPNIRHGVEPARPPSK